MDEVMNELVFLLSREKLEERLLEEDSWRVKLDRSITLAILLLSPGYRILSYGIGKQEHHQIDTNRNDQHLGEPMCMKQKSWSSVEQLGANWLEHVWSSPDAEQILQLDISSLKNTSYGLCLYCSASGGKCGTKSLLWTTRQAVGSFYFRYRASLSLPILGLPKLWTSRGMLGNLCTNSIPFTEASAPPKLWPVHRILETLQNLIIASAIASSRFQLDLQSAIKPAWILHYLHGKYGMVSKLKSSIQFWAFELPLQEVTNVSVDGQQPIKPTALVTLFSKYVTFTNFGR